MRILPAIILACTILVTACQPDKREQISELESRLDQQVSDGLLDSLFTAYQEGMEGKATNEEKLHYASRLAELKYQYKRDARTAIQTVNAAIADYGKDQNLKEAIGVLGRIWTAYIYKAESTHKLYPEDIDQMRANLQKNTAWIDSNLVDLENGMMDPNTGKMDEEKAARFIDLSEGYANLVLELNQRDKYADLLLKAAGVAVSKGSANRALQLYYQVESRFPDHPKAPTALFMSGFIYENNLNKLDKAKETYEAFLERYPDDPDYADDARQALKLLGKSPEELIREFEKQQSNQQ